MQRGPSMVSIASGGMGSGEQQHMSNVERRRQREVILLFPFPFPILCSNSTRLGPSPCAALPPSQFALQLQQQMLSNKGRVHGVNQEFLASDAPLAKFRRELSVLSPSFFSVPRGTCSPNPPSLP